MAVQDNCCVDGAPPTRRPWPELAEGLADQMHVDMLAKGFHSRQAGQMNQIGAQDSCRIDSLWQLAVLETVGTTMATVDAAVRVGAPRPASANLACKRAGAPGACAAFFSSTASQNVLGGACSATVIWEGIIDNPMNLADFPFVPFLDPTKQGETSRLFLFLNAHTQTPARHTRVL